MVVKDIFKELCIGPSVIVQDVGILVCDHLCLCVSRISLNCLDVTAIPLQLISYAGVPETVEHHLRQIVFLNEFTECPCDDISLQGSSEGTRVYLKTQKRPKSVKKTRKRHKRILS